MQQTEYVKSQTKVHPNLDIGIIVHWGLYSVPAFDSVAAAKRRRIQNGSEWYMQRLDSGTCQATKRYHAKQYGADTKYADFARDFTAAKWAMTQPRQPADNKDTKVQVEEEGEVAEQDRWMLLFKQAGASYVILTAKHHDGFCLFPTKTLALHVMSKTCAAQKDVLGLFRDAARRHGLQFGIYYSWWEFAQGNTCGKTYLTQVVQPQVVELVRDYQPDIFWFDGDWCCKSKHSQRVMDDCCAMIRHKLPHCRINDRVGHKSEHQTDVNFVLPGHYRVYADRTLPMEQEAPKVPWEHINTIGYSWGRNRQQVDADYKTGKQLHQLYQRVSKLNGRYFLLNVGPNADGTLCQQEMDSLQQFGKLLSV